MPLRWAAAAAILTAASSAGATPSEDFSIARQKFLTGAYQETVALITPLLYPPPPKLTTEQEAAEAHLLLAVAFYEMGQIPSAEREWKEALKIDSGLTVGPPAFTSKQAEFFSERKEAYDRELKREQEIIDLQRKLANMVVIERRDLWKNFMPFGVGQFQNGHTGKGLAFFLSQAAFVSASIGIWSFQGLRYGFRNGKVPPDELGTAEALQGIQIGTGVVALGLITWGIVDSFVYYKPTSSRKVDPDELDDILKDGAQPAEPATTFRLTPTIGPDYAGAGLSVEF
jgi:tetratricopeptide (TPR) repeat protein